MEFHGEFSMEIHGIPWNSMEVFHTGLLPLLSKEHIASACIDLHENALIFLVDDESWTLTAVLRTRASLELNLILKNLTTCLLHRGIPTFYKTANFTV